MARGRFAFAGVLAVLLCSCSSRFFPTEQRVRKQLHDNLRAYTAAAQSWERQPAGLTFYYPSDGHYRWGDVFIERAANGYKVGTAGTAGALVPDLAAAAAQAHTDEDTLRQWMDTAQQLKIYSIHKSSVGYVELQLWGADKAPYGLRYAPDAEAESALLRETNANQGRGAGAVTKISDHWYCFE